MEKKDWKNHDGMAFGFLFGLIVISLMIIPNMVNAKSCECAIAGVGADPGPAEPPAKHAEISSGCSQYVYAVYSQKLDQGDTPYNVKINMNVLDGSASWSGGSTIAQDQEKEQDYPDVCTVQDKVNNRWLICVVWQERNYQGGTWSIKFSYRVGMGGDIGTGWSQPLTLSNSNYDCLYPKIAACSRDHPSEESGNEKLWINVVWQSYNYGIDLNIYYEDSNGGTWSNPQPIATPTQNITYYHPAITCAPDMEVYSQKEYLNIIFEKHDTSNGYFLIDLTGDPQSQTWTQLYSETLAYSEYSYSRPKYPDVSSDGDYVDAAWAQNGNVLYKRSSDNGDNWDANPTTVSTNGPSSDSLRCVAISILAGYRSTVVWTNNNDVYFDKRIFSGGWGDFGTDEQWSNTPENVEDFVDVSNIYSSSPQQDYSHVIWQKDATTIYYARDP